MDIYTIKNNNTLKEILNQVNTECTLKNKIYSDIIDDEGLQYVDLVMEGGGMLGIALIGYTYVLEQAGIRFLGIGGTSAGSINALLLAALDTPDKKKGDKLLTELFTKNFFDFVDGDDDAVDFIACYLSGAKKFKLAFKGAQIIDNLRDDLGLNPGSHFTHWLDEILAKEDIYTLEDLQNRIETIPKGLRVRGKEFITSVNEAGCKLAIITADISTETKVEFPKMADLYWSNPKELKPSLFARASMSIPYFFHPLQVDNIPQNHEQIAKWEEYAGFLTGDEGGIPKDAVFVDGGVMSNFPIDIFHDTSECPIAPTFGVKLELDKRKTNIDGPIGMLGAIFNSARHTLDYDFIHKNPDYRQLVTWIPAAGYSWLDFSMTQEKKLGLFLEGAKQAADFLCRFDWEAYKASRDNHSS